MAVRSKASVCRRSLIGIVLSNPAGGMMSVSCECCEGEVYASIRLPGVLKSVVRPSVISKPQTMRRPRLTRADES